MRSGAPVSPAIERETTFIVSSNGFKTPEKLSPE